MTKIINGRIVSDSEASGESNDGSSWSGGMMDTSSTNARSVKLCGREFSSWTIGGAIAFSFLFGGFRGLFFASVIVGIAYCMENRGSGGSSTFGYSPLSTNSSNSRSQAPERGRPNIKGVKDLPKAPVKC